MSLLRKQQELAADLCLIEDRHERLASIVERARRAPPLSSAERSETYRVPGCMSAVWIVAHAEGGVFRIRHDADSSMMRGLVGLVCEVCDGARCTEVAETRLSILADLKLLQELSPTRRHGLQSVVARIQALARALQ